MKPIKCLISLLLALVMAIGVTPAAWAFCGFYVAKADTKLYNKASQVVIARDGNRTILTMANDYQGEVKDFALVVPVPVLLKQDQVKVGDPKIIERLDAFSAPRLVEYFDADPCRPPMVFKSGVRSSAPAPMAGGAARSEEALGVTVEARFTVGEYDILILSAKESNGLETWLKQNGYQMPKGAAALLQPYIRQKMKFFVAKVNLEAFDQAGFQSLRPLMMAYESPKFMLPIRLGMINAQAEQDLIVYLLSPKGQVELSNYRMVRVPSDAEIPLYIKSDFGKFYQSMFQTAYNRENRKVGFLEYAWDMGNCDPCSADPLSREELRQAGVFWLGDEPANRWQPSPVFITRLHVRYTRDKFPEDLMFQETGNRDQFQGRYILRHPFTGEARCTAGREYQRQLPRRLEQEAQTLARLTGWDIREIRRRVKLPTSGPVPDPTPWWENAFPK